MIILYIVFGIIVLILISGLFIPKGMKATREIIVNKPKAEVFNYIKELKNQDNFSKWALLDPNMKKEYRGVDGTVGAVSAWEGNKKVGKGEQEIKAIVDGRIETELRFEKPFKSVAQSIMTVEAIGDNTSKVSWGFEGSMNYPMNVMKVIMNMENKIGDDFSIGLSNLKNTMEK